MYVYVVPTNCPLSDELLALRVCGEVEPISEKTLNYMTILIKVFSDINCIKVLIEALELEWTCAGCSKAMGMTEKEGCSERKCMFEGN
jgi:hypothetical protein